MIGTYHFHPSARRITISARLVTPHGRAARPTCLYSWFCLSDQQDARLGVRDGNWDVPCQVGEGGAGGFRLGGGDQEGQAAVGGQEGDRYGEDFGKALHGSEGYHVEGGWGEGLGTGVLYIDVRQCKGAG